MLTLSTYQISHLISLPIIEKGMINGKWMKVMKVIYQLAKWRTSNYVYDKITITQLADDPFLPSLPLLSCHVYTYSTMGAMTT